MILLLFTPLVLTSCSEKITSAGGQEIDLCIDLASSGLDATVATTFILTVSGSGMKPMEETLLFSDGFLTGTVIVPAGPARLFRIEAFDGGGVLVYSGETVSDVEPGTAVTLSIDLYPRVQMVKVSPAYAKRPMGSMLPMEVKVFNIEKMSIFEGVLYNYGMITEDTYPMRGIELNPALKDIATLIYSVQTGGSVQFRVSHNFGGSLTDSNGYANLVTINIMTYFNDHVAELVNFYPGIQLIMDTEENIISPKDIYHENAQADLFFYTSSIVAEWNMGWGEGSEDPSWIEDTSPNLLHGTAEGTTILEGAYGNARYFNGYSDFIEVPDNDLLDLDEGITVAFWLDISDAYPVDAKQQLPGYFPTGTIISKRSENGAINYRISVENLSDADEFFSFLFTYGGSTTHTYRVDLPTWMLDGWNHYIFSYSFGDPSSALLVAFWDGPIAVPGAWISGDGTGVAPVTSGPLLMGKDNAEVPRYYSGGIDDVELFDSAFDIYVIERLYAW